METVPCASGSVKDAAPSVEQAGDLSRQVQEHPWLAVGGSIALGFLAAQLLKGSSHSAPVSQGTTDEQRGAQAGESSRQESAGSGTSLGGLTTWLGEQLDEVKGFASHAVMNYVHALVARGLDSVQEQLGQRGSSDEGRGMPRPQPSMEPLQGAHQ